MAQDILSKEGITALLTDEMKPKIKIDIRECVGSTNDELKALALKEEAEGYVLLSRCQTSGKGRLGRSFFSPHSTGVYMSLLLRPACRPQEAVLITTAAAVCVCRALEKAGAGNPQIKWVNDIFLNGRKVCGILTEAGFGSGGSRLDYAVLGVGLNMYAPKDDFPVSLQSVAGAAFSVEEESRSNRFVAEFLNEFFEVYSELSHRKYIEEYRKRCFVLGQKINIVSGSSTTPAMAIDVDENCNLVAETENGERIVLGTGEISVRMN